MTPSCLQNKVQNSLCWPQTQARPTPPPRHNKSPATVAASSQYHLCVSHSEHPLGAGWAGRCTAVQRQSSPSSVKTLSHARTCKAPRDAGWSSPPSPLRQAPLRSGHRLHHTCHFPIMHPKGTLPSRPSEPRTSTTQGPANSSVIIPVPMGVGASSGMPSQPPRANRCFGFVLLHVSQPSELLLQKLLHWA